MSKRTVTKLRFLTPHPPEGADDEVRRLRQIAAFVPLWPHEIADTTLAGRKRIVALLERALRAERRRGIAGHWSYDLARHARLAALWRQERDALDLLLRASAAQRKGRLLR